MSTQTKKHQHRFSKQIILPLLGIILLLTSCGENYMPKPYGYFRVDLPANEYRKMDTLNLPYQFELSSFAKINSISQKKEHFWIDINYPALNANIHCSYKPVQGNLYELSEDSRKYVYKHSVKADGIGEKLFQNPEKKVYGIMYDLAGNTASSLQFVITDSTKHFFRGALYFDNVPNKDSIAPMAEFIRKDVIHLMETFEWK